jgi:hypothetical protein
VLYNGTAPFPDRETLRLSDAYEQVEGYEKINLELEVQVYNINEGRNAETVNRCEELRGYAYFVHRVRYHEEEERRKGSLPETDITLTAIRKAIQDCKDKSLLADFLENLSMEDGKMCTRRVWNTTAARRSPSNSRCMRKRRACFSKTGGR